MEQQQAHSNLAHQGGKTCLQRTKGRSPRALHPKTNNPRPLGKLGEAKGARRIE